MLTYLLLSLVELLQLMFVNYLVLLNQLLAFGDGCNSGCLLLEESPKGVL